MSRMNVSPSESLVEPIPSKVGSRGTGTLGKVMEVLDIVASAEKPLRFTDILERSDQPRGTLHRQLSNLIAEGLLSVNANQCYELGVRFLQYAARAWSGNQFRAIAEPHLRRLHNETGETVHLGVLSGTEVVYLDKVEGRQAIRMYSQIGNASPAYCTGVGKAALAALSEEALEEVLGRISFNRFTEHTICSVADMLVEIAKIKTAGFACDLEEHELGIRCVASPVYSADRQFVAAISVTGPAYRVSEHDLFEWAELIGGHAQAIMSDMRALLGPRG